MTFLRRTLPGTGQTLKQKVLRGGIWKTLSTVGERLLGLVRTMILARLLVPEDFGLLATSLVVMGGLHAFTITGMRSAIVQWKDLHEGALHSAWIIAIGRGLILWTLLFFGAPLAADFFGDPRITWIIRVLSFTQLINGFQSVGLFLLDRELEFRARSKFDLMSGLFSTAVAIGAAIILRNVWALVIGEVAGSLIRVVLSYRIHSYRPKLIFNKDDATRLYNYGKHILIARILIFLITQGDDVIVGRYLGLTALGIYGLAYQLSNLPATAISNTISSVTFPAYAKLQDKPDELRHAYLRTFRLVTLVSVFGAALLATFAPQIVRAVYGSDERWTPMVLPLRVLCTFGAIRAVNTIFASLFLGLGSPEKLRNYGFAQLLVFAITIYPLMRTLDLVGVCVSVSIAGLVTTTLAVRGLKEVIDLGPASYLPGLAGILAASAAAAATGLIPFAYLEDELLSLMIGGTAFCAVFAAGVYVLNRTTFDESRDLVRSILS